MQNKGFVKVFAILLTLVCVFYLRQKTRKEKHTILTL